MNKNNSNSQTFNNDFSLRVGASWANLKPLSPKLTKRPSETLQSYIKKLELLERKWGNKMIGSTKDTGQWTTALGEQLVFGVLKRLGTNPRRPVSKNNFKPDWETDDYIYEVKTSNWWVNGTAGEKVLGTWIKYRDVPDLYGKPLRIVCVARQEHELEYGKTKFFGKVDSKTEKILELARSFGIEYIRFSDLVKDIL